MAALNLVAQQDEVIVGMYLDEFNLDSPRGFQVDVVREAVFYSKRVLVVQPTGSGKSNLPLATLAMRGGIGATSVPLLSIGTGQAAAARRLCKGIDAYHVDELSYSERAALVRRIEATADTSGRPMMLFISPLAVDGATNLLRDAIHSAMERKVVTVLAVDEVHRVSLDAQDFRPELARLKTNLFDKMTPDIAFIGMTATFSTALLEKFESITAIVFDSTIWGDVSRRNISMSLAFAHLTLTPLMALVSKHRREGKKVAVYSNHSVRVIQNLVPALQKLGEDAVAIHGRTGGTLKMYNIEGWASSEVPTLRTFKYLNVCVLCATASANCGIDSRYCGAVGREGPVPNLVDWAQEMGRIRPTGTAYPYEYLQALSVAMWAKLVLRIEKIDSSEEKQRQKSAQLEALKLYVLPSGCKHAALELAFGDPRQVVRPAACVNMCWHCNPSLSLALPGKVVKNEITRVLRVHFNFNGASSTTALVVKALHANSGTIFGESKLPATYASRLVLQLIAAEILAYTPKPVAEGEQKSGSVLLSWASGAHDLAYTEDGRWDLIAFAQVDLKRARA